MKIEFEIEIKPIIHYVIAGFANLVTLALLIICASIFSSPVTFLIYIIVSAVPYAIVREKLENFVDEVYKDGKFEGYKIKMDLCSHAKFLHDKLQNWIGLFQDETNSIKFSEAVKRVRSLAWEDKETGLEIRVPDSIKDLQNEGKISILSVKCKIFV